MQKKVKLILIICLLVLVDQITKLIFVNQTKFNLLVDWFYLESHKNLGSAFSLFSNISYYNYFVILLSIILVVYLLYKFEIFKENKYYLTIYILLISGIIGNLLDRVFFGYVRDFIGIKYFSIFNFADIYLTLVVVIYIFYELRENKYLKRENLKIK